MYLKFDRHRSALCASVRFGGYCANPPALHTFSPSIQTHSNRPTATKNTLAQRLMSYMKYSRVVDFSGSYASC
jgi:hypothetical protein